MARSVKQPLEKMPVHEHSFATKFIFLPSHLFPVWHELMPGKNEPAHRDLSLPMVQKWFQSSPVDFARPAMVTMEKKDSLRKKWYKTCPITWLTEKEWKTLLLERLARNVVQIVFFFTTELFSKLGERCRLDRTAKKLFMFASSSRTRPIFKRNLKIG